MSRGQERSVRDFVEHLRQRDKTLATDLERAAQQAAAVMQRQEQMERRARRALGRLLGGDIHNASKSDLVRVGNTLGQILAAERATHDALTQLSGLMTQAEGFP